MDMNILPAEGKIVGKVFYFPLRIYYEDTDAGGIVYYANYLKFAERARSECLRTLGINQQQLLQEDHQGFIVRSCQIDYISSARLDDALLVSCQVIEQGGASAVLHQEVLRGDEVLAKVDVKVVYMSLDAHRPTRIPPQIAEKFKTLQ